MSVIWFNKVFWLAELIAQFQLFKTSILILFMTICGVLGFLSLSVLTVLWSMAVFQLYQMFAKSFFSQNDNLHFKSVWLYISSDYCRNSF